jgi:hypothetical protein
MAPEAVLWRAAVKALFCATSDGDIATSITPENPRGRKTQKSSRAPHFDGAFVEECFRTIKREFG